MKKLLFATAFASTALASSMGCNTDTLTGLHFGLGVSVLFDKYEADVDVATVVNTAAAGSITTASVNVATTAIDANTLWNAGAVANNTGGANSWGGLMNTVYSDSTGTITAYAIPSGTNITGTSVTKNTNTPTAYVKANTFKKRTTNCGGEVKLAYFHDFGNHLMIGVDLTGIIASKNKKTVKVEASQLNPLGTNPALSLSANGNELLVAKHNGTNYIAEATEYTKTLSAAIPVGATLTVSDFPGLKAANPDYTIMTAAQLNELPGNFALKTQTGNEAELTFEKGVFNPRLAFIVGGTVYGWFAGLRMGMSYTTGKVYAKGLDQDKISKTVSISSPLIGLHLMKQMKIAGNNDAHLYLTADWNIGDGRRTVDINGVKSFRQTSYNISAGITWRFKLGN